MRTNSHHRKQKRTHPWRKLENCFAKSVKKIKELKENYDKFGSCEIIMIQK